MRLEFLSFVIFSILWGASSPHRILGVFPSNSQSHFTVYERVMKSLADRGHRVDIISSFPQSEEYPNYFDVVVLPPTHPSLHNNVTYDEISKKMPSVVSLVKSERGNDVCHGLGNEKLRALIKNPPKDVPYDAVVTEVIWLTF